MTGWSEVFLGVIAVATLATAVVQIGLLIAAGLLARRLTLFVDRVERDLKPVFGHLDAIGRDASRAASLVTAQVERIDRLCDNLAQRGEQVVNMFQAGPLRDGRAILSTVRAVFRVIRDSRRGRRGRGEDEDALFI